ncbi:hypothetical protein chiPu_0030569 [Chiloscyllium punctatum]|uniref:Uncharacterized protein n=1 Tax=Chiloscyllium punctatum TaxID=137246 RepID=A0A401TUK5_CHIPU|nr:hypothetical protein [Chiloscyllium punctatum]
MAGCAAGDLEWGPEGSLTRFIADENKKVIKAMLRSGWRPVDPLDAQGSGGPARKGIDTRKPASLCFRHMLGSLARSNYMCKISRNRPQNTLKPRRLPTVRSYRHYLSLQAPRRPPPGTGRGSWTTQAPGKHTQA